MNKKLILTLSSAALFAAFAQADPVTIDMIGHTGTNANSTLLLTFNGGFKTVTATPFNITVNDGVSFIAYCTELSQNAAAAGTSYVADEESIRTFLAAPVGDRMAYIYNNHHSNILTLDQQIAVQVALWEVRYDASYNLDAGNFQTENLNATIKANAQSILASVLSNANPTTFGEAMHYASDTKQDLMGPVPEPASLVALGLGAMALLRRRKNSK
jgi:hypothetical protein